MSRFILELLDEGEAELLDEATDETVWRSDEDSDFDGEPLDEDTVIDYLVRKGVVESENEIVEVVDETGEYEAINGSDDDDDADDAEETDDDD